MSKRLQVLLPEDEFAKVTALANRNKVTVSELVRECLRKATTTSSANRSSSEKLNRILRFAKLQGPTGDIDQILKEIDAGKAL